MENFESSWKKSWNLKRSKKYDSCNSVDKKNSKKDWNAKNFYLTMDHTMTQTFI